MHTYLYLKTKLSVFLALVQAIYGQCVSDQPNRHMVEHRLKIQGVPHPTFWSRLVIIWRWSANYTFKDLFHLSLGLIAVLGAGTALYALDPLTTAFTCFLFGAYVIWCIFGTYRFLNRKMVQTISTKQ